MLRALVLSKEPATLGELAILTGSTIDDVRQSLNKCSLLVMIQDRSFVVILENRVKEYLLKSSERDYSWSEEKKS